MCCIIHRPKDAKEIPEDNLTSIIKINPDGWGLAYFHNNLLQVVRCMEMDQAIKHIRDLEHLNVEFLFHARYATHGEKDIKNCHPYDITTGVLFHNGKIKIPCANIKLSDTYYFSLLVNKYLKRNKSFGWIVSKLKVEINESRLAFITDAGQISKFGKWHEEDGCHYSKLNWKYGGYDDDYAYWGRYPMCGTPWSAKENKFDELLDDCKHGSILYRHILKGLSKSELLELTLKFPAMCAEFLSRNRT